jgi:hypothetical protein
MRTSLDVAGGSCLYKLDHFDVLWNYYYQLLSADDEHLRVTTRLHLRTGSAAGAHLGCIFRSRDHRRLSCSICKTSFFFIIIKFP